jgi:hypothetical protein
MHLQQPTPERRSAEIIRRLDDRLVRPLERVRAALEIVRGGPDGNRRAPQTTGAGSVLIPGRLTGR